MVNDNHPSAGENEYACRAGTAASFAFGKTLSASHANFGNPSGGHTLGPGKPVGGTVPVGSYAPNAWGLYDIHGNVWEWCQDWFPDSLTGKQVTDPKGPKEGIARVNRGSSWGDDARQCRSATRNVRYPETKRHFIGLRLVLARVQQ